jgi:hypothetical protein
MVGNCPTITGVEAFCAAVLLAIPMSPQATNAPGTPIRKAYRHRFMGSSEIRENSMQKREVLVFVPRVFNPVNGAGTSPQATLIIWSFNASLDQ